MRQKEWSVLFKKLQQEGSGMEYVLCHPEIGQVTVLQNEGKLMLPAQSGASVECEYAKQREEGYQRYHSLGRR